jgi:hypothetical protein
MDLISIDQGASAKNLDVKRTIASVSNLGFHAQYIAGVIPVGTQTLLYSMMGTMKMKTIATMKEK